MQSIADTKSVIYSEITATAEEVTASFMARYAGEAEQFAELMAQATLAWQDLGSDFERHENIVFVANIVYCAITLHVQSMKLFLSGHIVAAGNLSRQVTEAIATALLSSGKTLKVLDRFIDDRYSTKNAVRDVLRHWETLGLRKVALTALAEAEDFYHLYSHLSKMTVASATCFSQQALYVGASFDEGKIDAYDREVQSRLGLAKVFPNFVAAVAANVAKW
ncbi:MAG: hypothetical protein ACREXW_05775 [Gammaproteobacteria bacterium]